MPEFKDMLKYYRMRENLSQSELAKKLGISPSSISMYEVGQREPDFETEEKIADFFNTDLNTLRGRDAESNEPYYFNQDSANAAQFLFDNPEYKVLFDASRKVKPEDIQFVADMIKRVSNNDQFLFYWVGIFIMENIRTILRDLPSSIDGFTIASNDGWYTIVLNNRLSYERRLQAFNHELAHITHGDFSLTDSADYIEQYAHSC